MCWGGGVGVFCETGAAGGVQGRGLWRALQAEQRSGSVFHPRRSTRLFDACQTVVAVPGLSWLPDS